MQITKVEIQNFRNIKKLNQDFFPKTAVQGSNHVGKTNTLHAIYWVLADALLDNSKTFDSITPIDDNRAVTSVTLHFDAGFSLTKTYREVWSKIRGSSSERLTGHETNYFINGMPCKTQSEYWQFIRDKFTPNQTMSKSIDIMKTLLNPLYLFLQEDWKKAREFITSLVKIKTDEELIAENSKYSKIYEDLKKNFFKTDMLMRDYNNKIENAKKDIKTSVTLMEDYHKQMEDNTLPQEEIDKAILERDKYNYDILEIKKGQVNVQENSLKDKKRELLNQIANVERELADKTRNAEIENYQKRKALLNDREDILKHIHSVDDQKSEIKAVQAKIADVESRIKILEDNRQRLLEDYKREKAVEFSFSKIYCPNCHFQLNEEEENNARVDFEKYKNQKLDKIKEQGEENNFKISKAEVEKRELEEKADFNKIKQLNEELDLFQNRYNEIENQIDNIPFTCKDYLKENDPKWQGLKNQLNEIDNQLSNSQLNANREIAQALKDYEIKNATIRDHFLEVERKKIICESNEENFNRESTRHLQLVKELTGYEESKLILKEFILAKLAMINESTKQVFPDIEFVLIEQNITEGSFNEVCYPLIKGKKTPFAEGSNSERILTGINLINDIHNFLKIEPLPIIFDEGETLDIYSVSEIKTDNQIIFSQVVNDIVSDVPTAKNVA